jgi:outer membrane protein assembly factor BamB
LEQQGRRQVGARPARPAPTAHASSRAPTTAVASFDAASGDKGLSVKTNLPLTAGPGFGDGLLTFGTADGDLLALDAATGQERWRQAIGSEILAAPAIGNGVIVVRTVDGRLRGFSAANGTVVWNVEQNLPTLTLRGNPAPRVSGPLVVSGFNNGRVAAYELADGDAAWEVAIANPTGRSELERLVDVSSGISIVGNDVYVVGYHGPRRRHRPRDRRRPVARNVRTRASAPTSTST